MSVYFLKRYQSGQIVVNPILHLKLTFSLKNTVSINLNLVIKDNEEIADYFCVLLCNKVIRHSTF
jgi:hypothetical protein